MLTSSRAEALSIPDIFTAPQIPKTDDCLDPSIYNSGVGDSRAYYVSGAFVARPYLGPDSRNTDPICELQESINTMNGFSVLPFAKLSPQQAYSQRLLLLLHSRRKFLRTLRRKIAASSPNAGIKPYSLPTWFTAAYETFRSTLLKSIPSPARLAFTDKEDILVLIKCCTGFLKKRNNIDCSFSVWIWSLLARLDDVGELTNPEVSIVRELGKKAARIMESYRELRGLMMIGASDESGSQPNHEVYCMAVNENEETTHESLLYKVKEVDELEARKANLLAMMESSSLSAPVQHAKDDDAINSKPSMDTHMELVEVRNTNATLDMIVLVVGEMFGQRDLLEHREALWR